MDFLNDLQQLNVIQEAYEIVGLDVITTKACPFTFQYFIII
jgi:hypothetical protein